MRSKKQQRLLHKKLLRLLARRKSYEKTRNLLHNRKETVESKAEKSGVRWKTPPFSKVIIPKVFSFLKNPEDLFKFVNDTFKRYRGFKNGTICFYMDFIRDIDLNALCLLISLFNKLSRNNNRCVGTLPVDGNANLYVKNSGFLDVVKATRNRNILKNFENRMYMVGKNQLDPDKIGMAVKKAMKVLTGKEQHFPPIYEILIEICSNSVEHANEHVPDKNWLISISHTDKDIHFILCDSGQGILQTLHRKAKDLFTDAITFKKDGQVLADVFDRKYQSQTKENNRHKGLPHVKECLANREISNLVVITNNVIYDFTNKQCTTLNNEHKGTLFCWDVTLENYNNYLCSDD